MVANLYRWDDKVTQADPPTHLLHSDIDAWNEWKSAVEGKLFLFGEDFSHLDLSGADLEYVSFDDCNFFKAKCIGTNFSYSTFCSWSELRAANFKGADLNYTQFWQCNFFDVKFNKSSMRNTSFFQCEFTADCTFKGVDVSTANGISHPDVVPSTLIDGDTYAARRDPKNGHITIYVGGKKFSGPNAVKDYEYFLNSYDIPNTGERMCWLTMVCAKFGI